LGENPYLLYFREEERAGQGERKEVLATTKETLLFLSSLFLLLLLQGELFVCPRGKKRSERAWGEREREREREKRPP